MAASNEIKPRPSSAALLPKRLLEYSRGTVLSTRSRWMRPARASWSHDTKEPSEDEKIDAEEFVARVWTRRALAIDPHDPMILHNVACLFSQAGDVDSAIDTLAQAVEAGLRYRDWIEHDSDFDPLREHPRCRELLARL